MSHDMSDSLLYIFLIKLIKRVTWYDCFIQKLLLFKQLRKTIFSFLEHNIFIYIK